MKFFKGMVVGTLVSTGVLMMMADTTKANMLKKKGRKLVRNIERMF